MSDVPATETEAKNDVTLIEAAVRVVTDVSVTAYGSAYTASHTVSRHRLSELIEALLADDYVSDSWREQLMLRQKALKRKG